MTIAVTNETLSNATVIRASAGTGKTFQLSNHFIRTLLDGARPDQILASTFTRNAAGEILGRVLSRLARAAVSEQERLLLAQQLQCDELPDCAALRALLEGLTKSLHRIRICTLDSFFVNIAESFSLELGLPPGWRILDDDTERPALQSQAIDQLLDRKSSESVLRLLRLMNAGQSKRSVTEQLQSDVADAYELYRDAELAAWKVSIQLPRMSEDEVSACIADAGAVEVSHGTLRKQHIKAINYAETDRWTDLLDIGFIRKIYHEEPYHNKPIPEALSYAWGPLIDHARAVLVQEIASQTLATHRLLEGFHDEFEGVKHRSRKLGFDDITRSLSESIDRQDNESVEFRLDGRISHLLLDEFQDTSMAQWKTLRPLVRRLVGRRDETSFFCVGDVKQAIYGWRGGVSRIFDIVSDEIRGVRSQTLVKSFRSCSAVIEAVNRVFSGMASHDNLGGLTEGVASWQAAFREHETSRRELPGYVDLTVTRRCEKKKGEDANSIILDATAEKVARLLAEDPSLTIGVLTRRNDPIRRLVYRLRKMGISASEEGGNAITDSAVVLAVQSLFQLADHPGDLASAFHVASTPVGKALGFTQPRDSSAIRQLSSDFRRQLVVHGYGETLQRLLDSIDDSLNTRDRKRMRQLVDVGFKYDPVASLRPGDFVRFVDRHKVASTSTDNVRVMTVHKAKGLQFDVVVLPELDQDLLSRTPKFASESPTPADRPDQVVIWRNQKLQSLLPDSLQKVYAATQKRNVEEAVSLLYVALTRAVHAIHMIVAPFGEKPGPLPRNSTGLICAGVGLSILEPETHHQLAGDPDWLQHRKQPSTAALMGHDVEEGDVPQVTLAPMPDGRQRGLQRKAPSSHSEAEHTQLRSRVRHRSDAELYGTMVHAWFEEIEWLDDGLPTDDEFRNALVDPAVSGLDIDEALASFHRAIDAAELRSVLTRAFYNSENAGRLPHCCGLAVSPVLEVHRERRFAAAIDGRIVSGSVDRLVLLRDASGVVGADILDFKTDKVEEASLRQHAQKHASQLVLYRRAISQMFGLADHDITTRLLFTTPRRVVDVAADGRIGT